MMKITNKSYVENWNNSFYSIRVIPTSTHIFLSIWFAFQCKPIFPICYQSNNTINIIHTKKHKHDYWTCLADARKQMQEETRETYWFCVLKHKLLVLEARKWNICTKTNYWHVVAIDAFILIVNWLLAKMITKFLHKSHFYIYH